MIRLRELFTLLLVSTFFSFTSSGQNALKVATFNVRYDNPNDSGNLWKDRSHAVSSLIRYHDFDVLGTQEAKKNQLDDISKELPEYARFGKGRDDGKEGGEHSAIFYKKEKFDLLASGDFWLSETPDKPGLGWDATCCNRICSWVHLKDKENKLDFFVFNVHFDHQGVIARKESAKLILRKMEEIAKGKNIVLTGDFNGDRASEWYKTLATSGVVRDCYQDVKYPYENNASFNSFGKTNDRSEVIDHIFVSLQLQATKWGILTDTYHGKFPSDHFPVAATISLKE